jgi:hypothetical protein
MTALLGPRKIQSAATPRPTFHQFPVKPGVKVFEGALIGYRRSTGYCDHMSADITLEAYGVARHTADNSGSLTPAPEVEIDPGVVLLYSTGLTELNEGSPVFCVDNQTFSLSSAGGTRPLLGVLEEVVSATSALVSVNPPEARAMDTLEFGAALTNADATILITAGKLRQLPATTLTGPHTLTLSTTGAKVGDKIRIVRVDATANAYTIANGGVGAGNVAVMPASKQGFVEALFDGTNFSLFGAGAL